MALSARETLRIGYGLLSIVAGADKFTNLLVDWEKYLARDFERKSPVSGRAFMRFVGMVEVAAGALVLSRWTRLGNGQVAMRSTRNSSAEKCGHRPDRVRDRSDRALGDPAGQQRRSEHQRQEEPEVSPSRRPAMRECDGQPVGSLLDPQALR